MSSAISEIISRVYDMPGRSTRAIVDLDAITENTRAIHANQGQDQDLMAVVKADGYGHGAVMSARAALGGGATRLGVATVGEAAALRRSGIRAPILVLGPVDPSEIDRAFNDDIELTVGTPALLDAVQKRAAALGGRGSVHVKLDTGMHRYGASLESITELIKVVLESDHLQLAGICTHLATADDPTNPASERQLTYFRSVVAAVRPRSAAGTAIHASNSAASIRRIFPEGTFERVGIAIYGLLPGPRIEPLQGMRPAFSLLTRLARVHAAQPGESVSYGRTYTVESEERLGLLPIGYADGYRRSLSNRAWAAVGGKQCPIRGRVCMDQTVIGDLSGAANQGDLVGVLGPLLSGPSVDEIAERSGTINYEIVTGIGSRVPRYYVRGGVVAATLIDGKLDEF